MEIISEIEHEDGSATYTFDMTEEERRMCVEAGILWMLVSGITGDTPTSLLEKHMQNQALDELVEQTQEQEKSREQD